MRKLSSLHQPSVDQSDGTSAADDRYRHLIEVSPDAIFVHADEKFIFVNQATINLFGATSADQLLGTNLFDRIAPPYHALVRKRMQAMMHGTRVPLVEEQFVRLDGSLVDIEVTSAPLVFEGRAAMQAVVRDVSERKRTEAALRASEEQYRSFIRNSSEAIWRFELDQPIDTRWPIDQQLDHAYRHAYLAECNDAMAQMYGYGHADELVGTRIDQLLPRSQPENIAYLRAFLESDYHLADAESVEVDRQGRPLYMLNNLVGVKENGYLVRAWGTSRNITDLKRSVDQIVRLQQVTASLSEALTFDQVADQVLEQAKDAMGAYAGSIALLSGDGQNVDIVRALGYDQALLQQFQHMPLASDLPLAAVVRTGVPVWFDNTEAGNNRYPALRKLTQDTGSGATAAVPLFREGRTIGAIGLSFAGPRTFSTADREWMQAIARQCALALERARLYEAERQARAAAQAAERDKEQARALLDTLFASAPIGFGFFDRDLRYVRVNDALAAINGVPAEEHIGKSVNEVLPHMSPEVVKDFQRVIDTGVPIVDREVIGETPAQPGSQHSYLASYYPVRDADDRTIGLGAMVSDITERKRVQAERDRFFTLSLDLLCIADADGYFRRINPAFEQTLGWTKTELLSRPFIEFVHPDDRPATFRAMDQLISGEPLTSFENRYQCQDGSYRWLSWTATAFTDGEPLVYAVARDSTERRQAEFQLRESEQRYRTLFNSIDEGFCVIEMIFDAQATPIDYRFVETNAMFEQQTGLHDAAGKTVRQLVPNLEAHWFATYGKVAQTGETVRFEQGSDAMSRWFDVYAFRIGGDNSRHVAVLFKDVTQAKRAALHQSFLAEASGVLASSLDYNLTLQRLTKLIVPHLADWCVVDMLEADGSIRRLEVAHLDTPGMRGLDQILRRFPPDPDTPSGIAHALRTNKSILIRDVTDDTIAAIPDPDYRQALRILGPVSSLIVPIVINGQATGALSLVMSASGRHYDEQDQALVEELAYRAATAINNARLYQAAQQAILVRDDFLSIASHELKTPITSLQLQAQSLLRAARKGTLLQNAPERLISKLDLIDQQAQRLTRLANDLLDVARVRSGRINLQFEHLDIGALVGDVIKRYEEQIEQSGSDVQLHVIEQVLAWSDRARLEQVMINLLSNALKYGAGNPIDIAVSDHEQHVEISIRDQGIGIAPDYLERIFVRFERAVSADHYGGLGLGLYIVRQIVEALGGSIRVASQVGQGATFTLILPKTMPPDPLVTP